MNQRDYLRDLSRKLKHLPPEERNAALEYYTEYFEDAGSQNAQSAAASLGSPSEAAAGIIAEFARNNVAGKQKGPLKILGIVLLGIFASPVALPIAVALFCVVLALIVAVFAVLISIWAAVISFVVSGLGVTIASFFVISASPSTFVLFLGAGLLTLGIGAAGCLGMFLLSRLCIKGLIRLVARMIHRKRSERI